MLAAPRLRPERALDPSYPLEPRDLPPKAARVPPPRRVTLATADVVAAAITDVVAVARSHVRVAIEIVVAVDVDSIVAAPAAAPDPTPTPKRAHCDADAKRNCQACGVVSRRRIVNGRVRIKRSAIHNHRIIRRHIHNLRIGLFDQDHAVAFDDFRVHLLLLARFQITLILSLLAHPLNGIHDVALLREECVAQIGGPLNVVRQPLYYVRQSGQSLDAWIPSLLCYRIRQSFVLQTLVLL